MRVLLAHARQKMVDFLRFLRGKAKREVCVVYALSTARPSPNLTVGRAQPDRRDCSRRSGQLSVESRPSPVPFHTTERSRMRGNVVSILTWVLLLPNPMIGQTTGNPLAGT